jgi:ATP-dependent helicase/nuclease subunit A
MSSEKMIRSACDPRQSTVVEACAGSGKTWLLVSRMIRLLLSGAKPHEILAITFTRKAAQEMKVRLETVLQEFAELPEDELLKQLQARGMTREEALDHLAPARLLFERVLAQPRKISIDTFHGWFSRLVQAAPIGSGLVRGASLREDGKRLVGECLEGWWAELGRGEGEFAELKKHYEQLLDLSSDDTIQKILLGPKGLIHQRGAWMKYVERCAKRGSNPILEIKAQLPLLDQPDPFISIFKEKRYLDDLKKIHEYLSKSELKTDKKYAKCIGTGLQVFKEMKAGDSYDELARQLHSAFLTATNTPLKDLEKISSGLKSVFVGTEGSALAANFASMRLAWADHLLSRLDWLKQKNIYQTYLAWQSIGQSMLNYYEQMKSARRVQDFSDLEWQASRLMQDEMSASYLQARLDSRYKHILIDEFQDTNPLQWQILQGWLSGYGSDAEKPTIFLVGDPKQSIYRFRRADARLFDVVKEVLKRDFGASVQSYDETRRNSPGVLKAVNAAFEPLALLGYPYRHQETHWVNELGLPEGGDAFCLPLIPYSSVPQSVEDREALLGPIPESKNQDAKQQHYQESLRVARMMLTWKQEREVIEDKAGKKIKRAPRWDDFLILVRTKSYLLELEKAFRELGVPLNSPRQGGLLQTLEADDLAALLEVLLTPTHDMALAQVLRSPIFSATDEHLKSLMHLSRTSSDRTLSWWDAMELSANDRLTHAKEMIQKWIDLSKKIPVHDLLDHIYAQGDLRRLYAQAVPEVERSRVLANLDEFLRLALDADGGRYPSLSRFILELKRLKKGAQEESPDEGESTEIEESDDDASVDGQTHSGAVNVMTIHGAKGLEAPFVFILDANQAPKSKDGVGLVVDWEPHETAPSLATPFSKELKTPLIQDALDREEAISKTEYLNLLYVAMTRAKQYLVISGVQKKPSSTQQDGVVKGAWYGHLVESGIPVVTYEDEEKSNGIGSLHHEEGRATSEKAFEFWDFGRGQWVVPADLLPRRHEVQETMNEEQLQKIDLGVAFHLILERVTSPAYLKNRALLDVPSAEILSDWLNIPIEIAVPARDAAIAVIQSEHLNNCFEGDGLLQAWNELDLIDSSGKLFRLDRLVEQQDQLLILDYKFSIPSKHDALFGQYEQQLKQYVRLVAMLRPDKPIRSCLVDGNGQVLWID